jgi:hypothetical protein
MVLDNSAQVPILTIDTFQDDLSRFRPMEEGADYKKSLKYVCGFYNIYDTIVFR